MKRKKSCLPTIRLFPVLLPLPPQDVPIFFDTRLVDGMFDGMKKMIHRTTFALDESTARRLKHLSRLWQVSQAEVVRRAVANAESIDGNSDNDPIALLERLHAAGQGLLPVVAEKALSEVREGRKRWRD